MNVLNEKRLKDYKELQTLHTNEDHHRKRYSDSFSCASVSSLGTTTTTAGRSLQTNISSCLPQTLFGLPRVQATGRGGRGGREAKNEWGVFE